MLSVPLPEAEVAADLPPGLSFAAINGPGLCLVSGEVGLDRRARGAARRPRRRGEASGDRGGRALADARAHPGPFAKYLRSLRLAEPRLPFVSNVTGTWIRPEEARDPAYWVRHLRQPVRFADGLAGLVAERSPALLEVGPGRTLTSLARLAPGGRRRGGRVIPALRHPQDPTSDLEAVLAAMGQLWIAGVDARLAGLLRAGTPRVEPADLLVRPRAALDRAGRRLLPPAGEADGPREEPGPLRLDVPAGVAAERDTPAPGGGGAQRPRVRGRGRARPGAGARAARRRPRRRPRAAGRRLRARPGRGVPAPAGQPRGPRGAPARGGRGRTDSLPDRPPLGRGRGRRPRLGARAVLLPSRAARPGPARRGARGPRGDRGRDERRRGRGTRRLATLPRQGARAGPGARSPARAAVRLLPHDRPVLCARSHGGLRAAARRRAGGGDGREPRGPPRRRAAGRGLRALASRGGHRAVARAGRRAGHGRAGRPGPRARRAPRARGEGPLRPRRAHGARPARPRRRSEPGRPRDRGGGRRGPRRHGRRRRPGHPAARRGGGRGALRRDPRRRPRRRRDRRRPPPREGARGPRGRAAAEGARRSRARRGASRPEARRSRLLLVHERGARPRRPGGLRRRERVPERLRPPPGRGGVARARGAVGGLARRGDGRGGAAALPRAAGCLPVEHPLLQRRLERDGETVFPAVLDASEQWVLDEHRLRGGDPVLPGTAFVEMARAALAATGAASADGAIEISNLAFTAPLVVPEGEPRLVETDLRPADDGSVAISIRSVPAAGAGRRARGGPRARARRLGSGHDRRREPSRPGARSAARASAPASRACRRSRRWPSGPDGRRSAAWPSARRRRWRTSSCRRRSPGTSRRTAFTPASSTWPRASRSPSSRAGRPCTRRFRTAGCARHSTCPAGSSATCAFAPGPARASASSTRRSRTSRAGWWPRSKATW